MVLINYNVYNLLVPPDINPTFKEIPQPKKIYENVLMSSKNKRKKGEIRIFQIPLLFKIYNCEMEKKNNKRKSLEVIFFKSVSRPYKQSFHISYYTVKIKRTCEINCS